jgi:DNA-binding NtrC family response regulator
MIDYIVQNYGSDIFLIGSDYIYPRKSNEQVGDYANKRGANIVGEVYLPLGTTNFSNVINQIKLKKPSAVLSTLVGKSNVHFYRSYYKHGSSPIFSPTITEIEVKAIGSKYMESHYGCSGYFQSLDTAENQQFVKEFKEHNGREQVLSSRIMNAYIAVQMLLQAICKCRSTSRPRILESLKGNNFLTPAGIVKVDPTFHLERPIRIGRVNQNGQFNITWDSDSSVPAKVMHSSVESLRTDVNWPAILDTWSEDNKIASVVLNSESKIIYINPKAYQILGLRIGNYVDVNSLYKLPSIMSFNMKILTNESFYIINLTEKAEYIPKDQHSVEFTFDRIQTKNSLFIKELSTAKIASQSDSNIIILGETGSGKEVLARSIHNQSSRCNGPFIAINMGAIPKELIYSELFGYIEGSFTGARKGGAMGKFEAAHKGTLFLDEIGEMPLDIQVSLLRVIEERKVTRIGDVKERPIDIRIIAATNKNLNEEIAYNGTFRSDLFYRLNVFSITIPPLRQRKEDIHELAITFLQALGELNKTGPKQISQRALKILHNHHWPGNIRELRNVIEYAFHFIKDGGLLEDIHLPHYLQELKLNDQVLNTSLQSMEQDVIIQALKQSESIVETAKKLGISRGTLYRKMKKWNIPRSLLN